MFKIAVLLLITYILIRVYLNLYLKKIKMKLELIRLQKLHLEKSNGPEFKKPNYTANTYDSIQHYGLEPKSRITLKKRPIRRLRG